MLHFVGHANVFFSSWTREHDILQRSIYDASPLSWKTSEFSSILRAMFAFRKISIYEYIYHFIYYFCITFVFINQFDPIDRSIEWITPLSIDKDLSDWFFLQFYSFLSLLRIHFYQSILHSKSLMENGCRYLVDSIHACNTM